MLTASGWVLLVLLAGPPQKWEVIAEGLTWQECMARGFNEMGKRPERLGMRCEIGEPGRPV